MSTVKPALVLEGGGFRGSYTAGVIDVLLEEGLADAFSVVWGVSAGATNAATFRSRQIGRTIRDFLAFRDDPRFMSFQSMVRTGDIAGSEFIYDEIMNRLDPFDYDTFHASDLRMVVVATDALFGTPAYFEIARLPEDTDKVRASASLPVVSEMVELDGGLYLDGGTADAVPVEAALGLADGVGLPSDLPRPERAVVVLTQHRGYVKGPYQLSPIAHQRYGGYPYLVEALDSRPERYNAQRERIWELEREGRALVIAPEDPVELSLTESDGGKLLNLYVRGRQETKVLLPRLREFVEG